MHHTLIYICYGWLAFSGTVHFVIDVVSQRVRGKHVPGEETTLFYGLHSSYAFGQVMFGLLCLCVAWSSPTVVTSTQVVALSLAAGVGWLAIAFSFIGYWQPRMNAGIFIALLLAAAVTA